MSRSPERMSSYRRHFEDSSCSCYQVRVSSPSPTRRETSEASVGYSCRAGASSMRGDSVGRRNLSAVLRTRLLGGGVSAGVTVCVGPKGETPMDLNVAAAENQEFLKTRSGERQEMVVLNDRLAGYIDKVRSLEQHNMLLEAEIEAYRNRFQKPTGLRLLYEEQLKEQRKIAEQMRVQRDISLAAKDARTAQLEAVKIKYEEAVKLRKKAERDVEALRPDVDKATSSCIAMEKKLEQLEAEIEFLKRVHQQEIDELMKQIHAAHVSVQNVFDLPDMAAALKQIQTQYDSMAAKNLQEMDSWYKNKFEDLTSKTSRHVNTTRSFREELSGAKRDIQSKENDLENLRTRNEALEAQIREKREKYRQDVEDLQARIEALQLELKSTKEKIAVHLREYQDLLNIKMSLEMEITTYRKLIEGEDLRLSGMMQTVSLTHCSTSAIGAGMSSGGGGMGGVGGMGGGVIEDSGGSVGGMVSEVGRLGSGAGGLGLRIGAGGLGYRKGPTGRARGADMASRHGFDAGGVGASARDAGTGGGMGAAGISGAGSGADGVDARDFGSVGGSALGNIGGGIGAAGLDTSSRGVGAVGLGTGSGGVGAAGLGTVAGGVGAVGLGTVAGGVGAAGLGSGTEGVGAAGLGSGTEGVGAAGFGSGTEGVGVSGLGSGTEGVGVSGLGSGTEGVGVSGLGSGTEGVGAAGFGSGTEGVGVSGLGSGTEGVGVSGLGSGTEGVGVSGLGSGTEGVGVSGLGSGTEGVGAAGLGSGTEGVGVSGLGSGAGGVGVAGGKVDSRVNCSEMGAGSGSTGSCSIGDTGMGFRGGSINLDAGKNEGVGQSIYTDGGKDFRISGGIKGRTGSEGAKGGPLSDTGGMGDPSVIIMGYGSTGYGPINDTYVEQAVELTKRRTVLIRTVRCDDNVLHMDLQEKTYTITGAADDSDDD